MISEDQRPWFETAFGSHYTRLYNQRDEEEARRCLDLLVRLRCLGDGTILDLGCGPGRHLRVLLERGLTAIGLDLSMPLLSIAAKSAAGLSLVRADMRRLPFQSCCFTTVLSMFTTFGYFGQAREHEPAVRDIARVLIAKGHWVLDFLDSERVADDLSRGSVEKIRNLGSWRVQEIKRLAFSPRRVIKTVRITPMFENKQEAEALGIGPDGLRYDEEVSLLSLAELNALAAGAGLFPVAAAGGYDGRRLVPGSSERWLLVYRLGHERGSEA